MAGGIGQTARERADHYRTQALTFRIMAAVDASYGDPTLFTQRADVCERLAEQYDKLVTEQESAKP